MIGFSLEMIGRHGRFKKVLKREDATKVFHRFFSSSQLSQLFRDP
jgi:hypothetical protein